MGVDGRRSRGGSGVSGREGPAPDSLCGVIYDPGGELKFSCPPQTQLSNETDALFIIKAPNSELWEREALNTPPPPKSRNSAPSSSCAGPWNLELVPGLIAGSRWWVEVGGALL